MARHTSEVCASKKYRLEWAQHGNLGQVPHRIFAHRVIGGVSVGLQVAPVTSQAGRYISEGFDDARLDTLFLAMPVLWKGALIQYTGRLHRLHPAKKEVRIFDYVDGDTPVLQSMFEKRLRGYRGTGHAKGETALGIPESGDEIVVEDDKDVLPSLKEMDDFA